MNGHPVAPGPIHADNLKPSALYDENPSSKDAAKPDGDDQATLPGLNSYLLKATRAWKIIWILIFIAFLALSIYFVALSIYEYVNAGMSVSTEFRFNDSLQIPNLALCYSAPLNDTALKVDGMSDELIVNLQASASEFAAQLDRIGSSQLPVLRREYDKFLLSHNLTDMKALIQRYAWPCTTLVPLATRLWGTTPMPEFCQNSRLDTHLVQPACYYFHSLPWQSFAGALMGINIRVAKPTNPITEAVSSFKPTFSIDIYDENLRNLKQPDSVIIQLDTEVHIAFRKLAFNRKISYTWPKPQHLCQPLEEDESNLNCEHRCVSQQTIAAKGCLSPGTEYIKPGQKTCSPYENMMLSAKDTKSVQQLAGNVSACMQQCTPLCEEIQFQRSVTSYQMVTKNGNDTKRQEFSNLAIGYSELSCQVILESDSYEFAALISNIGGQLGLWLGWSFLDIVQCSIIKMFHPKPKTN